jgi:hypothetical protein
MSVDVQTQVDSRVAAPMMASAMRRANRKDLDRLKAILEASV